MLQFETEIRIADIPCQVVPPSQHRADGVTVLNDVVLDQVLVRFEPPAGGDADAFTRAVIAAVQAVGTRRCG